MLYSEYKHDTIKNKINAALISPITILSIVVMIINDHYLKFAKIMPQILTGKISDFAFLIFIPLVLAFLLRISTRTGLLFCYFIPGLALTLKNLSSTAIELIEKVFRSMNLSIVLWSDPTDLAALLVLPLTYFYFFGLNSKKSPGLNELHLNATVQKIFSYILVVVTIVTCINTSPRRENSHEPIYISWEEFRASVEITGPRQIESQGKIYIMNNHLFLNEPNRGIHIFDISKKENPVPLKFIKIYGNVDLAVKGNTLYADSYTDLLIFDLRDPANPKFIKRINDQFSYDPIQSAPKEAVIYHVDDSGEKGVIIKWIEK